MSMILLSPLINPGPGETAGNMETGHNIHRLVFIFRTLVFPCPFFQQDFHLLPSVGFAIFKGIHTT